jgi:hypothetical protein
MAYYFTEIRDITFDPEVDNIRCPDFVESGRNILRVRYDKHSCGKQDLSLNGYKVLFVNFSCFICRVTRMAHTSTTLEAAEDKQKKKINRNNRATGVTFNKVKGGGGL